MPRWATSAILEPVTDVWEVMAVLTSSKAASDSVEVRLTSSEDVDTCVVVSVVEEGVELLFLQENKTPVKVVMINSLERVAVFMWLILVVFQACYKWI
jgi:hypothetical protein